MAEAFSLCRGVDGAWEEGWHATKLLKQKQRRQAVRNLFFIAKIRLTIEKKQQWIDPMRFVSIDTRFSVRFPHREVEQSFALAKLAMSTQILECCQRSNQE